MELQQQLRRHFLPRRMRVHNIFEFTMLVLLLLTVGSTASRINDPAANRYRRPPVGRSASRGKQLSPRQPGTRPKVIPIRPTRKQRAYKDGPEWAPAQFRVLVHCLQSSGCTYFMAILGQSAQVVTVLDVAINSEGVPARAQDVVVREDAYPSTSSNSTKPDNSSHPATIVVAKVPIWGLHEDDPVERLRRLQRQFNPHATLLFVRHPVDNLASLNKHRLSKRTHNRGYALSHGDPDSKLQALEKLWKRRQELFSEVIYYPELFLDRANVVERLRSLRRPGEVVPSIGLPITHCNFCCLNAVRDLVADTKDRLRFRVAWGGGGINHLSPAAEYWKGSRKKDLIDEVKGVSPETLRGSDRSEKSLSKEKKTKGSWSSGTATLEDASGDGFILACAAAERSKECAAQKRRLPHPSENKTRAPVASSPFAGAAARVPVGMRNKKPRGFRGGTNRFGKPTPTKRSSILEMDSSEETAHLVGFFVICSLLAYLAKCGGNRNRPR